MEFFVYLTHQAGAPMTPPTPEGMAQMMELMQDGIASGLIVSTGQLSSDTTHVQLKQGQVTVTDGPFLEGKELIPGYTVIRVDSKQQAIEWVTRLRRCMGDGELRMAQVTT